MEIVKQVAGIDVAQDELVVSLARLLSDQSIEIYAYEVFKNTKIGMASLLKWVKKLSDDSMPVRFVMEATGVYHEKFAYYLDAEKQEVTIVLPNKISNYIRTLDLKTVNDKTCSKAIAQFGLERNLNKWKRPNVVYKSLQQLTRERSQIIDERTMVKNQLHAEKSEAFPHPNSVNRLNNRIIFLDQQVKEILNDINESVKNNKEVKESVTNICSIPGVALLSAVIVLAETNGFELIKNKKQLTSYAGLDVIEKQSGTSIKGKPRISKRGNRNLRKSMHMPALTAIKHNPVFKEVYLRLLAKSNIKMKALVAVQRKMLELIYIVHKNKTLFDADYEKNKRVQLELADTL